MQNSLLAILQSGLALLGLELAPTIQDKMLKYIMLLYRWNQVYNLTAIREPESILIKHVLDSLAVTPYVLGPTVLDFGTGAGLPGIPLALALPKNHVVLLDSSTKKTVFLQHVVFTLGLKNVAVMTNRIEKFCCPAGFATVITRATAKLHNIITKTTALCSTQGQILVMTGRYPTELKTITQPKEIYRLKVPYLDAERHLVRIYDSKNYSDY